MATQKSTKKSIQKSTQKSTQKSLLFTSLTIFTLFIQKTQSEFVSEKSANQFLRSKRGLLGSDLKEDCVEEYCNKEEFLEAAENVYGDECAREGPGGSIYENYYKRCTDEESSSSGRKRCMETVKSQMIRSCDGKGVGSYVNRGQNQGRYSALKKLCQALKFGYFWTFSELFLARISKF